MFATAGRMPQDAVEGVFVGFVNVVERHLQGDFGPVSLASIANVGHFGIELIERNVVGDGGVGRQVGFVREATRHGRGGSIKLVQGPFSASAIGIETFVEQARADGLPVARLIRDRDGAPAQETPGTVP